MEYELIEVHSVNYGPAPDILHLDITARFGEEDLRVPFTYIGTDPYGLNPEITAWLMSNPGHPIGAYVAPTITVEDVKYETKARIADSGITWMLEREMTGGDPVPQAIKDYLAAVRATGTALEAMEPIPQDYRFDHRWPAKP